MKKFFLFVLFFVLFAPMSVFAQQLGGWKTGSSKKVGSPNVGGLIEWDFTYVSSRQELDPFGDGSFTVGALLFFGDSKFAIPVIGGFYTQNDWVPTMVNNTYWDQNCGCYLVQEPGRKSEQVLRAGHLQSGLAFQGKKLSLMASSGIAPLQKGVWFNDTISEMRPEMSLPIFLSAKFRTKGGKVLSLDAKSFFVYSTEYYGRASASFVFPLGETVYIGPELGYLEHLSTGQEYQAGVKLGFGTGKNIPFEGMMSLGASYNQMEWFGFYARIQLGVNRLYRSAYR